MPEPFDLTTVIEDSISDAAISDDSSPDSAPESEAYDTASPEAVSEAVEAPPDDAEVPAGELEASTEVASPGARTAVPEGKTFGMDKKLGIASHTNGRENRIPYSRVKKIVEKAEKEALEPIQKQLAELTPRVQEYESRLGQVAQFEQVMLNEPQKFFEMLSTIPAYQGFFQMLNDLQGQAASTAQQTPQTVDNDPMPQPDDEENGVYTMDGLNKLLDWQKRQAKSEVMKEVEDRYEPLRREYEVNQRLAALAPVVDNQIKEARTWEQFNENEDEIVQFLNSNPNASLETAYRVIVTPKLRTDKSSMRQQILKELQKAPAAATSVSARPFKSTAPANSGPRSMEDVILEQVRAAGLK